MDLAQLLLPTAQRMADAARAAALPHFRSATSHAENKAQINGETGYDPVTEADKAAERAMREVLANDRPDDAIEGEEYGAQSGASGVTWYLDPVDGTRAFIAGLPVWTTLIALRHQGDPVLGSIGQPYVGELFIGSQAAGSRLIARGGESPLKVRDCPNLTDAIIATTDPEGCFNGAELGSWTQVRATARVARTGCDAYAYAMVAAGKMDLVVEAGLKSWDIDAAVPVIEGAGGLVTDWRGTRIGRNGGQMVIAGDRACLDEALVTLRRSAK